MHLRFLLYQRNGVAVADFCRERRHLDFLGLELLFSAVSAILTLWTSTDFPFVIAQDVQEYRGTYWEEFFGDGPANGLASDPRVKAGSKKLRWWWCGAIDYAGCVSRRTWEMNSDPNYLLHTRRYERTFRVNFPS
jgi:hypothetical protein